jgi:hypothetical protein
MDSVAKQKISTKQKISKVYDYVHVMLWSGLAALLIFFALYTLPNVRAFQAEMQAARIIDMAAEDEALCTRLAMGKGTPAHDQCLPAVQEFRAAVVKRLADDSDI